MSDDYEIERGSRCYRCRGLHIEGSLSPCGTARGVGLTAAAIAVVSIVAAVVAVL